MSQTVLKFVPNLHPANVWPADPVRLRFRKRAKSVGRASLFHRVSKRQPAMTFPIQYEFKSQNLKYTAFLPYFSIVYPGAIHHGSLAYGDIYALYLIFY